MIQQSMLLRHIVIIFFFFYLLVVFKQVSTYVQTSKLHFSLEYMICFIRNTFISNVRLKLATKIKQMLSNTMRLNLCYLKIILILPLNSHPTIIVNILKNKQKNKRVWIHDFILLIITKAKHRSHRDNINRVRPKHGHKLENIKGFSVWWCLYVLSNTHATFEAQFMKKLNNTKAEWK